MLVCWPMREKREQRIRQKRTRDQNAWLSGLCHRPCGSTSVTETGYLINPAFLRLWGIWVNLRDFLFFATNKLTHTAGIRCLEAQSKQSCPAVTGHTPVPWLISCAAHSTGSCRLSFCQHSVQTWAVWSCWTSLSLYVIKCSLIINMSKSKGKHNEFDETVNENLKL